MANIFTGYTFDDGGRLTNLAHTHGLTSINTLAEEDGSGSTTWLLPDHQTRQAISGFFAA